MQEEEQSRLLLVSYTVTYLLNLLVSCLVTHLMNYLINYSVPLFSHENGKKRFSCSSHEGIKEQHKYSSTHPEPQR